METLQASGISLTHLHLSRNRLSTLRGAVNPSPAALKCFEADENQLEDLPDWLSDCLHLGEVVVVVVVVVVVFFPFLVVFF